MEKNKLYNEVVEKHYANSKEDNLMLANRKHSLFMALESTLTEHLCKKEESDGEYPLDKNHICFSTGHNMMPVCSFQFERFAEGTNKCTRCGHIENWKYDFK